MDDKTPIRYDPNEISGATGLPIRRIMEVDREHLPERKEFGSPLSPRDITPSLSDRKQPLHRDQWESFLDETRVQYLAGHATLATEVAHTVRDLLREYETETRGTPIDRLRAIARVLAGDDDRDVRLAGKFVEIALLALEAVG